MQAPLLCASALVALGCVTSCGRGLPSTPAAPAAPAAPTAPAPPAGVPGDLPSGEVDPSSCGNYAAVDAGRKLKTFLQAVKDLQLTAAETVKVVKQSCVMMGQELGMAEAELTGETDPVCNKVIATYQDNLKISLRPNAKLRVKYEPATCQLDAGIQARVTAECEAGGSSAAGQCQAAAGVQASLAMTCSEPKLVLTADNRAIVDKTRFETTIKALRNGLPKLLSVQARLAPLKAAVEQTVKSAGELKAMGPKFTQSFPDQGVCIAGQIAAALKAATEIQGHISVSITVTASASATAGAG